MQGFAAFTINNGLRLGRLLLLLPQRLGGFQFVHLWETTASSRHFRVRPRLVGLEKSEGRGGRFMETDLRVTPLADRWDHS